MKKIVSLFLTLSLLLSVLSLSNPLLVSADAQHPIITQSFDYSYELAAVSKSVAPETISQNLNKAFIKSGNGSLRVQVPTGDKISWARTTIPFHDQVKANWWDVNKVSFWLYNNTNYNTTVFFNSNIIIDLSANAWTYVEFNYNVGDWWGAFSAVYDNPWGTPFYFEIPCYDWRTDSEMHAQDVFIDDISFSTSASIIGRKINEIESFDDSRSINGVGAYASDSQTITASQNTNPAYIKGGSAGSLKLSIASNSFAAWTDTYINSPAITNIAVAPRVSFWLYNNSASDIWVIFNNYAWINAPANSWKYYETWWDGVGNSDDYWGVFPNPWSGAFKFTFQSSVTNNIDLFIDEIQVDDKFSFTSRVAGTYNISSGSQTITNIAPVTSFEGLRNGLSSGSAIMSFKDTNGANVSNETSAKVGTGTSVVIQDGSTILTYKNILYGDTSGDGYIDVADLSQIKNHILKSTQLAGDYLSAAKVSRQSNLSILDLLAVKKHILNLSLINQA
jgi:hypothetical protein